MFLSFIGSGHAGFLHHLKAACDVNIKHGDPKANSRPNRISNGIRNIVKFKIEKYVTPTLTHNLHCFWPVRRK